MLTCPYCKYECPDNAYICPNCGKPTINSASDMQPYFEGTLDQEKNVVNQEELLRQKQVIRGACVVLLLAFVIIYTVFK